MNVTLRRWTLDDVEFSLKVRNNPDLMKYFRQNEPLKVQEQAMFIFNDLSILHGTYNGHVVEVDGVPAGLCGVKDTREFTIGILPEFQGKGVATDVMQQLYDQCGRMWSEVFVGNPALEWFVAKLNFKVVGVKERAYYKPGQGLVDVVRIERE